MSAEALYVRDPATPGAVVAQPGTSGPWDPAAQHGGAPAALLGGAIEATAADETMRVARVSIELLRPAPVGALRVETEVVRPGRRVQLVRASLWSGEHEVVRATALRMRRGDGPAVAWPAGHDRPWPAPDAIATLVNGPGGGFGGSSMELRPVEGTPMEPGPGRCWFRLRIPVFAGEPLSPLQRTLAAADFGNGISSVVSWDEWSFINPDLTVFLDRDPVGEWIGLDAVTTLAPDGTGLAESALSDARGRFGRAVQSLLVLAR